MSIVSMYLKPLNRKAEKVFKKIIKGVKEHEVKTIDNTNGTYMPVKVEIYCKLKYGKVYSVGHFYEQMGDLMSDPRMEFLVNDDDGRVYPILFEQHGGLPIFQEDCNFDEKGNLNSFAKKWQNQHKNFANMWMENIQMQQKL